MCGDSETKPKSYIHCFKKNVRSITKITSFQLVPTQPYLHRRASLQVLFDLRRVLPVEPLCLLVEPHVPLIDVVNVVVFVECSSAAELGTLLNPVRQGVGIIMLHFDHLSTKHFCKNRVVCPLHLSSSTSTTPSEYQTDNKGN